MGRDKAARRGCRQGQWATLCPTQANACLDSPCSPFTWLGTVWRLSRPPSAPRKALTLWPLFSEGLSPRGSPGAEGHSLSQCQVSSKDPPQIGVFPARIFALGEKVVCTVNWKFGGDGLQARPRFKMLPA